MRKSKKSVSLSIDERFRLKNRIFLRRVCSPIKRPIKNYTIVKMPPKVRRRHKADPIALSGSAYDRKLGKRVKIILIDEGWLGGIRRRYQKGGFATKSGIKDTVQHIILHEKAHSKGIVSEREADKYADKILIKTRKKR